MKKIYNRPIENYLFKVSERVTLMLDLLALITILLLFFLLRWQAGQGKSFTVRVLTATLLGIGAGLVFSGHTTYVGAIGTIYAHLLKAIVVPVLFFSIISTVASLGNLKTLTTIGAKTIGVLSLHNVLASATTIIVALALGVGRNAHIDLPSNVEVKEVPSLAQAVINFFPQNIIEDAANNRVIPIIVFSLFIGVAILTYQNKKEIKAFTDFIDAGHQVIFKVAALITRFTPYAVLALLTDKLGGLNLASLGSLLLALATLYLVTLFHSSVTTGAIIGLLGRLNPVIYLKKFFSVWMIAFSTQSSVGSVPANVSAQKEMGVPEYIASFTSSIGTTFGMPGCAAAWPVLLAIFTINALGLDFGLVDYLYMVVVALLVSAGTVGVPGTATITATAMFTAIGLPVEMIIVLTPISAIADMARTATNVTASGSTGLLVARFEKVLNLDQYYENDGQEGKAYANS